MTVVQVNNVNTDVGMIHDALQDHADAIDGINGYLFPEQENPRQSMRPGAFPPQQYPEDEGYE